MMRAHHVRASVNDTSASGICRPFFLRWFPCVFALVLVIAVPSIGRAQEAAATPADAPALASSPAPGVQPPAGVAQAPATQAPAANVAPAEDIRDIRGPISIPSPWRWLSAAAAGVAVLALLYAAWLWYRRRATAKAKQPHEIALERLERARALMKPELAREYSFAISEITRDYIERRFDVRAARRTTDEFLRDLVHQSDSPLAAHQSLLADVLRYCDLAKFARWQLDMAEMEAMHDSARAFITATRPNPEALKRGHSKNGSTPHPEPAVMAGAVPAGRHS